MFLKTARQNPFVRPAAASEYPDLRPF